MTDSNHAPNHSSTGPPDYEGTDPDLPDRKNEGARLGVSTIQVGASAGAAVTSALAASFFGVAGTLIGAAVGSIVSTIAGALYSHYLGRAGERIKVTKDVVIHRIPGDVRATSPLRHLTGPSDLPGRESLQPIGDERHEETVALPVEDANELLQQPDGMAPLDQTAMLPAYGSSGAEAAYRSVQVPGGSGAARAASNGAGSHQPAANGPGPHRSGTYGSGPHRSGPQGSGAHGSGPHGSGPSRTAGAAAKPWWKRPGVAMAAVSAAGFLIALVVVLATETVIGHPVSGGDSGTTFSKIGSSGSTKTKVTPTEKATEAPNATETPSAEATTDAQVPTETTNPTESSDSGPNAPGQSSAEATDPAAVATDSGAQGLGATPAP